MSKRFQSFLSIIEREEIWKQQSERQNLGLPTSWYSLEVKSEKDDVNALVPTNLIYLLKEIKTVLSTLCNYVYPVRLQYNTDLRALKEEHWFAHEEALARYVYFVLTDPPPNITRARDDDSSKHDISTLADMKPTAKLRRKCFAHVLTLIRLALCCYLVLSTRQKMLKIRNILVS